MLIVGIFLAISSSFDQAFGFFFSPKAALQYFEYFLDQAALSNNLTWFSAVLFI